MNIDLRRKELTTGGHLMLNKLGGYGSRDPNGVSGDGPQLCSSLSLPGTIVDDVVDPSAMKPDQGAPKEVPISSKITGPFVRKPLKNSR